MGFFDQSSERITGGPVGRIFLILAGPIFVQNMVHVVQQVIDLYWIGRFSSDGVAAVGLATPILLFLLQSSISATFVGTQVLVSQRIGADDELGAQRSLFNGLVLTLFIGLGIGGLIFFNVDTLLELISSVRPGQVQGDVLLLTKQYLSIIALGVVFAGLSDVVEAAFLGWGDSRATLYINVATVVVNSILTPIFMFGIGSIPSMGIEGAALGTVSGYVAGLLLGVLFMLWGPHGLLSWSAWNVDIPLMRELLDIGLPQAVKGSAETTGNFLIVILIFVVAGSAGLVAYTVSSRVGSIAFRTTISFNQAAQTIVGQNIGAGDPSRAIKTVRTGAFTSVCIMAVFASVQYLFPDIITQILSPSLNGRGFELATVALQILAISYPASAILSLVKAGFNGAKRTKTTMVASLVQTWGIHIPLAAGAVLLFSYDIYAVFWTNTIATFVVTVGLGGYFIYQTEHGMYQRAVEQV